MGRELRRVPMDYRGHNDPRTVHDEDYHESCRPPEGPGYQLWATTGPDTPISPVYPTLERLCVYAARYATTFADYKATKEQWFEMLSEYGFAITPIAPGVIAL